MPRQPQPTEFSPFIDILNIQMVASLRQFLILLLVLLQMAAPLVHAHVGQQTAITGGLHLPELEMLKAVADHTVKRVTLQHIDDHSVIIELGAALKQPEVDLDSPLALLVSGNLVAFPPSPVCERVNFSPQHSPAYTPQLLLSANICRAPPL